ncbi:hypothetical protein PR048_005659 [Dryococelus australis]|uniref:Uncharacterized protein n=1 Tax=Dryococelus australis TaxID=614101 RepID=A0ABQ9I9R8_9NEOP|nr:hypothetical protein PR048_005659 [Dryococelus australis]
MHDDRSISNSVTPRHIVERRLKVAGSGEARHTSCMLSRVGAAASNTLNGCRQVNFTTAKPGRVPYSRSAPGMDDDIHSNTMISTLEHPHAVLLNMSIPPLFIFGKPIIQPRNWSWHAVRQAYLAGQCVTNFKSKWALCASETLVKISLVPDASKRRLQCRKRKAQRIPRDQEFLTSIPLEVFSEEHYGDFHAILLAGHLEVPLSGLIGNKLNPHSGSLMFDSLYNHPDSILTRFSEITLGECMSGSLSLLKGRDRLLPCSSFSESLSVHGCDRYRAILAYDSLWDVDVDASCPNTLVRLAIFFHRKNKPPVNGNISPTHADEGGRISLLHALFCSPGVENRGKFRYKPRLRVTGSHHRRCVGSEVKSTYTARHTRGWLCPIQCSVNNGEECYIQPGASELHSEYSHNQEIHIPSEIWNTQFSVVADMPDDFQDDVICFQLAGMTHPGWAPLLRETAVAQWLAHSPPTTATHSITDTSRHRFQSRLAVFQELATSELRCVGYVVHVLISYQWLRVKMDALLFRKRNVCAQREEGRRKMGRVRPPFLRQWQTAEACVTRAVKLPRSTVRLTNIRAAVLETLILRETHKSRTRTANTISEYPDQRESCRTMPLVGGFSRGSPVSRAPAFWRCSIITSFALIGSQDLDVKRRSNLSTELNSTPHQRFHQVTSLLRASAFYDSGTVFRVLKAGVGILLYLDVSWLTNQPTRRNFATDALPQPTRVKRGGNGSALECKDGGNGRPPRKPADQRHRAARFPHVEIWGDSAGNRTRLALVGGMNSNQNTTVALISRALWLPYLAKTQHDENIARQSKNLLVAAKIYSISVAVSPLSPPCFSASNAVKSLQVCESLKREGNEYGGG